MVAAALACVLKLVCNAPSSALVLAWPGYIATKLLNKVALGDVRLNPIWAPKIDPDKANKRKLADPRLASKHHARTKRRWMMSSESDNETGAFWADFYEEHYARLKWYAQRLVKDRQDVAEDLLHATFLRVLVHSKHPQDITHPTSYLLTIMRNLWIDKYKREHLLQVESLDAMSNADSLSTVEPQIHDMLENEELLNTLRINRGPLTLREQQLLIRYLQGYSCSEIAEEMSDDVRLTRCDLNAVKAKVRYRLMRRKGDVTPHGRYNTVHRQTRMALKGGQQPFHSELISALVN